MRDKHNDVTKTERERKKVIEKRQTKKVIEIEKSKIRIEGDKESKILKE